MTGVTEGNSPIPYPQSGWGRLISFVLAIVLAALIFVYPKVVAASINDVRHGLLTLLMWGIATGFIHGTGFVPRMTVWRIVFHPFLGWLLMLLGIGLFMTGT